MLHVIIAKNTLKLLILKFNETNILYDCYFLHKFTHMRCESLVFVAYLSHIAYILFL